jgi:signal peptidase II
MVAHTRRHILWILPVIGLFLDQWSKFTVKNLDSSRSWAGIEIVCKLNKDLVFFHSLSAPFALPFEVALGLMLVFSLNYSLYRLINTPSFEKMGIYLTILCAGLLGNLLDRIFHEAVIDFIRVKLFPLEGIIFNLADVYQIVGFVGLFIFFCFNYKSVWDLYCRRQRLWIAVNFQSQILGILLLINFVQGLIFSTFIVTYVFHQTKSLYMASRFSLLLGILLIFWCAILFPILLGLSARIAGPVLALKAFNKGERGTKLTLRDGDFFKDLMD